MFKRLILIQIFILIAHIGFTQNIWSLQQCIDYALKNNINVKQSNLQVEQAYVNLEQNRFSVLPNLNGSVSNYYNIGKRIDQYTNKFADKRVRSDNYSLSSNITIFNGLQQYNNIKQSQLNIETAKHDADANNQNVILNIASAYLNILYAIEQLQGSENQIIITKQQEQRAQILVNVGSAAKNTLLDIQSQLASEELNIVNAQNTLDIAYLNLTLLLDLPSAQGFSIVKPTLPEPSINENIANAETIVATANSLQPSIKAAESRIKSAYTGIELAKGNLLPSLTVGGSIGSGFSGLSSVFTGTTTVPVVIGQTTSGEEVFYNQIIPTGTKTTPYGEQLQSNLNKSFGFQLSIPIFNGFQVKSQIARAKISYENAKFNEAIAKRDLNRNVRQAYADAVASVKKYKAIQKSVEALQASFKNTETRFEVGVINAFEFNDAKNKLAKAKIDLLQSKYDYHFKLKVLEFYQGKPITL
jgi:outer membrane protein